MHIGIISDTHDRQASAAGALQLMREHGASLVVHCGDWTTPETLERFLGVAGVYGGAADKFPVGPMMNKALRIHQGQTHTHRYVQPLLERIEKGEIDPSFVITHTLPLDQAPEGYDMFREKKDGCVKVVLKPWA